MSAPLSTPADVIDDPEVDEPKRLRTPSVALRLIGANLCRAAIWFVVGLMFWGVAPLALGWHSTTVMSGSMEPRIPVGSVVVVMPAGDDLLTPGRVIQSDDPDHPGRLRLHRIESVDDAGSLVTKGDANQNHDSSPVTPAQVRGIGVVLVPFLGIPVKAVREGNWAVLAIVSLGAVIAAAGTRLDYRFIHADDQEEGPDDDSAPGAGSDTTPCPIDWPLAPPSDAGSPPSDPDRGRA